VAQQEVEVHFVVDRVFALERVGVGDAVAARKDDLVVGERVGVFIKVS
jgi:hypothetical protein